jgi:hypothetical protein
MDFLARQQILTAHKTKQRQLIIPRARGANEFWRWYLETVSVLRPGTPEIELVPSEEDPGPYDLTKPCVLAFSGGAESSLIKHMWPDVDTFRVANLDSKNLLYTNPLEGGFAIIGAGLGYAVTFYGAEMAVGEELEEEEPDGQDDGEGVANLFETESEFARHWLAYSGAQFLSPVARMDKCQIVKQLVREGIDYCSCIHSGMRRVWCGDCRKCMEAYYVHLMLGVRPPFNRWKRRRPTANTKNQRSN